VDLKPQKETSEETGEVHQQKKFIIFEENPQKSKKVELDDVQKNRRLLKKKFKRRKK